MADARPWLVAPDPRPTHDQIIDHDLVGKSETQLLSMLIIELRRLREDIAQIAEHVRQRPER